MQATVISQNTNEKWVFFSVTNKCGMFSVNLLYWVGMFFSGGLAMPWLQAYYWREFFKRASLGGRRVRFTGDGCGFFSVFILNYFLSIVTFGFWILFGCASDKINSYMDEHLEWEAGSVTVINQVPAYAPQPALMQPYYAPQTVVMQTV